MAYTILDLVTHLRRNILHDTGGQGVDWAAISDSDYDTIQLRWSNEELVSNINEAIRKASRSINPIKDIVKLNLRPTKNLYTLDPSIKKVISVRRSDGRSIEEKSLDDYFEIDDFDTAEGDVEAYICDDTSSFRIYKTPSTADYLNLKVYRLPKNDYTWSDQNEELEVPDDYCFPLLNYAVHLAYLKDEANTFDPQKASGFLTLFLQDFPNTSVYSSLRKQRTSNRPVKYGGL